MGTVGLTRRKGKARWMIIDDALNSDHLIEFIAALIKDADKKPF